MRGEEAGERDEAAEQEEPEREGVEARERDVRRADLQRHDDIGEAREERGGEHQQHDRAVHGEQLVVLLLRLDDLHPGLEQLEPDEQRHDAADAEEREGRDEVHVPDGLVVRRGDPLDERCAPSHGWPLGCRCASSGVGDLGCARHDRACFHRLECARRVGGGPPRAARRSTGGHSGSSSFPPGHRPVYGSDASDANCAVSRRNRAIPRSSWDTAQSGAGPAHEWEPAGGRLSPRGTRSRSRARRIPRSRSRGRGSSARSAPSRGRGRRGWCPGPQSSGRWSRRASGSPG